MAAAALAAYLLLGPNPGRSLGPRGDIDLGTGIWIEGNTAPVAVEFGFAKTWPRLVEWKVDLPPVADASGNDAGRDLIRGGDSRSLRLEVEFRLFGYHSVGPVMLRVRDPFDLMVEESVLVEGRDVKVQPRVQRLSDDVLHSRQQRTFFGAYEISKPGDGFDFFGLRDYVPGDRPRDINWKASARRSSLVVNQHQRENDSEVVILVDVRRATRVGRYTASPFAEGCRAALSVADSHLSKRDSVRFVAYGEGLHEDRHTGPLRHLQGVIDVVTSLDPQGDSRLRYVLQELLPRMRHWSPVLIVSPLIEDPSISEALALLLALEHPVTVFVPRPDWGDQEGHEEVRKWRSEQEVCIGKVRSMGVPTLELPAGVQLETVLPHLKVIA